MIILYTQHKATTIGYNIIKSTNYKKHYNFCQSTTLCKIPSYIYIASSTIDKSESQHIYELGSVKGLRTNALPPSDLLDENLEHLVAFVQFIDCLLHLVHITHQGASLVLDLLYWVLDRREKRGEK